MAIKKKAILVKLKSTGSSQFWVKKRNPSADPLQFKKYDSFLRKKVLFKEERMK